MENFSLDDYLLSKAIHLKCVTGLSQPPPESILYQFKMAEVTSGLNAAMFFGGIGLYCTASIEYTKQIAIQPAWRALGATQTLQ